MKNLLMDSVLVVKKDNKRLYAVAIEDLEGYLSFLKERFEGSDYVLNRISEDLLDFLGVEPEEEAKK